jgi:hypothetical protein
MIKASERVIASAIQYNCLWDLVTRNRVVAEYAIVPPQIGPYLCMHLKPGLILGLTRSQQPLESAAIYMIGPAPNSCLNESHAMTTSAVVQTFLFIHLGVLLVVPAYCALGAALAPVFVTAAANRFASKAIKSVLVGLALSAPWVGGAIFLLNREAGGFKFAGAVVGCLWVLCGLFGGSGPALHLGRSGNGESVPWVQSARGGALVALSWFLPLAGWFGMLPLSLATGVGCMALVIFAKGHSAPPDSDAQKTT